MTAPAVIAIPRSCKFVILLFIASLLLLVAAGAARAASWDDLDEGETKIFGSEKEQKFTDMFFIQREKWENHPAITHDSPIQPVYPTITQYI